MQKRAIGSLRFGAPLIAAQVFGKPTLFRFTRPNCCELIYASAGFQLDFEEDRLAYAAFFVGPDEFLPECNPAFCTPRFASGATVSSKTGVKEAEVIFGSALTRDEDERETILYFEIHGLAMELEFNAAQKLKRVNLFPSPADAA